MSFRILLVLNATEHSDFMSETFEGQSVSPLKQLSHSSYNVYLAVVIFRHCLLV